MVDRSKLDTKKRELEESLAEWASEKGLIPAGYRLVVLVTFEFVASPPVEVSFTSNEYSDDLVFTRRTTIYMKRNLTNEEIMELRRVRWTEHQRHIVDFILDRGNAETASVDIDKMLEEHGYEGPKQNIRYSKDDINSRLYTKGIRHLRLTVPDGAKLSTGPIAFTGKKIDTSSEY